MRGGGGVRGFWKEREESEEGLNGKRRLWRRRREKENVMGTGRWGSFIIASCLLLPPLSWCWRLLSLFFLFFPSSLSSDYPWVPPLSLLSSIHGLPSSFQFQFQFIYPSPISHTTLTSTKFSKIINSKKKKTPWKWKSLPFLLRWVSETEKSEKPRWCRVRINRTREGCVVFCQPFLTAVVSNTVVSFCLVSVFLNKTKQNYCLGLQ